MQKKRMFDIMGVRNFVVPGTAESEKGDSMEFDRKNWQLVQALLPQYDEYGNNGTLIWLTDGQQVYDPRRVDTVLKALAGVFAVDVSRLRRNVREALGRSRNVPLVLHERLWLMPVVCRTVQSRHDGAIGYLVYQQVEAVESREGRTAVHFAGQAEALLLPERDTTVRWMQTLTEVAAKQTAVC